MEEFMTKNQANYYSGITSITVNGKASYELKGRFLDDLRENAFSGTNGEDTVEHIEYFLKFVDPIDLPNVNHERLRLAIFPISLVGNASKWFDECGELPGMVQVGYMTYFQDYEWYDDLTDKSLKEEALKQKSIYEKSWGDATQSLINFCTWLKRYFRNFYELDYELLVKLEECWWKINDHECSPFPNWRDHICGPYANVNTTYDPYLDGMNGSACNDNDIQEKKKQRKERQCDLFDDLDKKTADLQDYKTDPYSDTFYRFQYGISWFWDTAYRLPIQFLFFNSGSSDKGYTGESDQKVKRRHAMDDNGIPSKGDT
ncbi:hypothetical protein Tco_0607676 [Tanacetum coccineum]